MALAQFTRGSVVVIDDKSYSLRRLVEEDTWQLESEHNGSIKEYPIKKLLSLYESGKLTFKLAGPTRTTPFDKAWEKNPQIATDHTPQQIEIQKIRRAYVNAMDNLPGEGALAAEAIKEVWEKLGRPGACPSGRTVSRWRKAFREAGKTAAALVPRDAMKGNYAPRMSAELNGILDEAIRQEYLTEERKTVQDTLDYAIARVNRENSLAPKNLQLPRPTRRQIERLIAAIPAYDRHVSRYGRDAADNKFRHVKGHYYTDRPLQMVQIDHSPVDCFVIDETTGQPMRRPWLTVAIDVHTRRLLAIYISFDPPSYLTVARCLRMAMLPKENLLSEHPEVEGDWDAYGVPELVMVDNGREFHSISLQNAALALGLVIQYAARKKGWLKPHVERVLGTMLREVAHGIPGTTFSNILEKGDYDPQKHAIVTLSALRTIAYKWAVDVYDKRNHRTLQTSPAIMWKNSIKPEDIRLPANLEQLDAVLGRSDVRKLTHAGIVLDKLSYNSPDMETLRRRYGASFDVDIRIDDSDLGSIIVLSPDQKQLFRVPALRQDYAAGLTRYQHGRCKNYAAKQLDSDTIDACLEAKLKIAELIQRDVLKPSGKSIAKLAARYTGGDLASAVPALPQPSQESETPSKRPRRKSSQAKPEDPPAAKSSVEVTLSQDTQTDPSRGKRDLEPGPSEKSSARTAPKFVPIVRNRTAIQPKS